MSRFGLVGLIALGALLAATSVGASSRVVRWFHSPSGNIECEIASADARGTYAYCQTFTPLQTATLERDGHTKVCSRRACAVGNGPEGAPALGYGRSVRVGIFRCSSALTGMRCVVFSSGHGFTIARQGVKTF